MALVEFVKEHLLENFIVVGLLVISNNRMYFDHAEHHAFSDVCVGVTHLVGQNVREALEVVNQFLPLDGCQERLIRLCFLHFLYISQLVLDHPEQRLQSWGLL